MRDFVELLVGRVLGGRYELGRLIGRGGMGAVFAGRDNRTLRTVAVKVFAPKSADAESEQSLRARFAQEALTTADLKNSHLVYVFDVGTDDTTGIEFFTMELLEGEDIQRRLQRNQWDDLDFVMDVILQAADGLGAVHSAGLVHRDIKPSNLFLENDGDKAFVRILDFGIVRAQVTDTERVTRPHLPVPLTPAYAAPEQLRHDANVGPYSDVFSLAVTAFEMLTHQHPFSATQRAEMASQKLGHRPKFPLGVPLPVADVIRRGLAFAPEDRYKDAKELGHALREAWESSINPSELARGNADQRVGDLQFHLAALTQVGRELVDAESLEDSERAVLDAIGEIFFAWWAALYVDEGQDQYICQRVRSPRGESVPYAIPSNVVRANFSSPNAPVVPDEDAEIRDHILAELSVLVPLSLGDGRASFIALGRRMTDEPYRIEDLSLLQALALFAGAALRNGRLIDKLESARRTDPLTGCLTRAVFDERLEQELVEATRYGYKVALIRFEVGNLASINAEYGYSVGDDVLHNVGEVLCERVEKIKVRKVIASRYGGGEFAILLVPAEEAVTETLTAHYQQAVHALKRLPPIIFGVTVATYPDSGIRDTTDLWMAVRGA